jgi:hypothetical protein
MRRSVRAAGTIQPDWTLVSRSVEKWPAALPLSLEQFLELSYPLPSADHYLALRDNYFLSRATTGLRHTCPRPRSRSAQNGSPSRLIAGLGLQRYLGGELAEVVTNQYSLSTL